MNICIYLIYSCIIISSCNSYKELIPDNTLNKKSIFDVEYDEFKLFKGKTINDFISHYKERPSKFLWEDSSATHLKCYIYLQKLRK